MTHHNDLSELIESMKNDALEQAKKETEKRRRREKRRYRKTQRLIEKEDLRRQIKINKDFDKLHKQEKKITAEKWEKEIKTTAEKFRRRRKQTEINTRKATRETKTWESEVVREEKRRRKEVLDWKTEAQKWKKESQRLRRNEKARERRAEQKRAKRTDTNPRKAIKEWESEIAEEKRRRKKVLDWKTEAQKWKKESQRLRRNEKAREKRAEQNRRIGEGKWKGKKKFGKLQLNLEDKLSKIWSKRSRMSFTPIITDSKHAHGGTVSEYTIPVTVPLTHQQVLSLSKEEVLKLVESAKKPVKVQIRLECIMEKTDPATGEVTTDSYYPSGFTSNIFSTTDISRKYDESVEKISNDISEYQKNGSGWTLKKVVRMIVRITEYQIVRGAGFFELPKFITNKKTVINMKNEDNMCFKYAVTRALHPVEREANVVSKLLKKQSEKYNWEGLTFPVAVKDVKIFSKNNDIGVNVFGIEEVMETDPDGNRLVPAKYVQLLTEPTEECEKAINLFWHDNHFSVVKCLSRLLSSKVSGSKRTEHFCPYCLNHFGTRQLMVNHIKDCRERGRQRTIFPKPKGEVKEDGKVQKDRPTTKFKNHKHTTDVPFSIQADIECMIMDIELGRTLGRQERCSRNEKEIKEGACAVSGRACRYVKHGDRGF